jgi:hypothetical protein
MLDPTVAAGTAPVPRAVAGGVTDKGMGATAYMTVSLPNQALIVAPNGSVRISIVSISMAPVVSDAAVVGGRPCAGSVVRDIGFI